MRIVYVLNSLGMGGAEKQALAVAERMAKRGHQVAVVTLKLRVRDEWPATLETVRLGLRANPVSLIAGLLRARRFLIDFQPDVIHSHSFHANILARLLRIVVPHPVVVSTIHNVYEGGRARMFAYRLTDRLSRRTIAVSEAVQRRFIELKAVPQKKFFVAPNGIDSAEFAPEPAGRDRVRAEMGVSATESPDRFVWLAAGRVTPAKDYPNLLRAFVQVSKDCANAELWIAGAPSLNEGKRAVNRASRDVDVDAAATEHAHEQVRWLGLRRDMPALLDAADGFVLASAWEGMPLALVEAMAMEKPVVATDVGGVRELVGDAGAVVAPKDSDALAEAMIAVMRLSRQERAHLGLIARERVVRHFNIEATADAWEACYRGLLV